MRILWKANGERYIPNQRQYCVSCLFKKYPVSDLHTPPMSRQHVKIHQLWFPSAGTAHRTVTTWVSYTGLEWIIYRPINFYVHGPHSALDCFSVERCNWNTADPQQHENWVPALPHSPCPGVVAPMDQPQFLVWEQLGIWICWSSGKKEKPKQAINSYS